MPALALASAFLLFAHNPDTSYARVEITAEQIRTRLTYDVFTLLTIVPLDDNRDGQLSRAELSGHLPEISGFLREHIWLTIGTEDETEDLGEPAGFVWPPDTGDAIREADFHAATGLIHFDFVRRVEEVPEQVALTFGFFQRFGERHTVLGAFAAGEREYEVTFARFAPDFEYVTGMEPPLSHRLWRFFKLGVEHIFLGYDHICFLIALIVVSKFREVVKIVTSFTIAHSITLILATLDVVQLPGRLVESSIAATIVYVAIENLWVKDTRHRWWLTFFFGLVHGFGFAGVLRELGLPRTGLVRCLLMFNLGVEVGQLAIALALLPIALVLARWKHGRKAVIAISLLLAAFGLAWFIDRVFALDAMPF
jgi:hydrogenase/urease accessory protein HupE